VVDGTADALNMVRAETEGGGGGSSTVTIGIDSLRGAIDKLDTLASSINSARASAQSGTPMGLPSLADGSPLSRKVTWLEDQKAPLQAVLDLGILLDDKHSGTVSFTGSGDIDSIKAMLGRELANDLDDVGDIKDVGDRERMTELAAVLARYATDPAVARPFADELGPDGVVSVLQQLRGLTDETGSYLTWIANDGEDVWKETGHLESLQDSLATSLAEAVGAASNTDGFDKDFGDKLVNGDHSDGWTVGTLFQYGAKNDVVFGKDLLVSSGEALLEREESMGWQQWQVNQQAPTLFGTDHGDDKLVDDPVLQWMKSLANNADASQTILLDDDRARYLLGTRNPPYEEPPGSAAGDVLKSATIEQALDPGDRGRNAAQISSNVIEMFGAGIGPDGSSDHADIEVLKGVQEELGGIIATYIADVDTAVQNGVTGLPNGTYAGESKLPDWLKGRGMPSYGITTSSEDIRDILNEIGGNTTAVSTVAQATTHYNQARLDHYAVDRILHPDGEGDNFLLAAGNSAQLTGFMQDSMVTGDIDDATERTAARKKIAGLFTLPLDVIPAGKILKPVAGETLTEYVAAPIAKYIIGDIDKSIESGYTGDGVASARAAGDDAYGAAVVQTRVQALYSLVTTDVVDPAGVHHTLPSGSLAQKWPPDAYGNPMTPGELSTTQIAAIMASIDNDGYAGEINQRVQYTADNEIHKVAGSG
jgi:hypothetical protein